MTKTVRGWWRAGTLTPVVIAIVSLSTPASSINGGVDVELGGPGHPELAVSPTDPLNIACASGIELRVSTDGGASWQPPVWADGLGSFNPGNQGRVAFDSQGRLFWLYSVVPWNKGNRADQFLARCDPTSGAILPGYPINVTVAAGIPGSASNFSVGGCLAADSFGASPFADALYATWLTFPSGGNSFYATSRSTDQGLTWSPAIQLGAANSATKTQTTVTVGPNGDVYAAVHRQPGFLEGSDFFGLPNGISGRVVMFHSSDGGASFAQVANAYPAGGADMTWNTQDYAQGAIPGAWFALNLSIRPWILADPNVPGRIYVVCTDDPDDDVTSGDAADIFLVVSTDHGASWGTPTRIDGGPGITFQVLPTATIDRVTGAIVVTYYDNRHGATNGNGNYLLDLFLRVSLDGGQTFSADIQVNDVPFDPDAGAERARMGGWALFDVWAASATDVFAAGNAGTILRYDGASWSLAELPLTGWLSGISGSSASDVFAVGLGGRITHYDGNLWSDQTSGTGQRLEAVWCNSPTDCFAVGYDGTILHYDGNTWSTQTSGTSTALFDVWGSGGNDVFAVGVDGTILHYNGSSWAPQVSGTLQVLLDVWGASSTDVFAVGYGGTILHYDGSVWTPMSGATGVALMSVWGSNGSDVFAVGYYGTIVHYDGTSWSMLPSGSETGLDGVWGVSGGDVHAVGYSGQHHYDGSSWTFYPNPTEGTFTTRIGGAGGVAAAGGQISVAWSGNTTDGNEDPLDRQTLFDRLDVPAVGVEEVTAPGPARLALEGTFPNPFAGATTIQYRVPRAGPVRLVLYDLHGRRAASLVDRVETAGRHTLTWDSRARRRPIAAGVYFLRLEADGEVDTHKVTYFR